MSLQSAFAESDYLLNEKVDPIKAAAKGIEKLWEHFPYPIHTFHFLPGGKNPVETFTDPKTALKACFKRNSEGSDVYFMSNPGDGVTKSKGEKGTVRCQEAVTELRACFIDTDNCPIEKVTAYLESIDLLPHLMIETSPGRFHVHFHLEPTEKTDANIVKWDFIQHMLPRLGDASIEKTAKELGTDDTMADHSKILRVPGFFHVKKKSLVKVHSESDHPPYTLQEMFDKTNAQALIDHNKEVHGNAFGPPKVLSLDPTQPKIEKDDRFNFLRSQAMILINQGRTWDDALITYTHIVKNRLNNTEPDYYKDGEITQKALGLLKTAFERVEGEEKKRQEELQDTILHKKEHTPSIWSLPDEFYLSAPGGLGEMVEQAMKNVKWPSAAIAFGTFLTGMAFLKSLTHWTPSNCVCVLYILNIADSGYGKNGPMTMMQNTFLKYGLSKYIANEIRSDRGLYCHMAPLGSKGLIIMDEVAPFLRAIQKEDASGYMANLARALLSLYTSGGIGEVKLGKNASSNAANGKGEKELILLNPVLGMCGYTVPSQFGGMFNEQSISKGLLARLIPVSPEVEFIPPNRKYNAQATLESKIFEGILASAMDARENIEGEEGLQNPVLTDRVRTTWDDSVLERFEAFELDYRHKYIDALRDPTLAVIAPLYSRIPEQVERMATALAPGVITMSILEYCIKFLDHIHRATMKTVERTILRGEGAKGMELQRKIVNAVTKAGGRISKYELARGLQGSFKDKRIFDDTLQYAVDLKYLKFINVDVRGKLVSHVTFGEEYLSLDQ